MKGMRFQPAELTVHPGETVEFKNEDIFAHTVTADDGSFDSGLIQPGSSWKMTVQKAGTIAYHCTPHPNMKAMLVTSSGTQAKRKKWRGTWFARLYAPALPTGTSSHTRQLYRCIVAARAAQRSAGSLAKTVITAQRSSMDGPVCRDYYSAHCGSRMVVEKQVCRNASARVNRRPSMAWNIAGADLYCSSHLAVAHSQAECCPYFALSGIRLGCCARTRISGKPGRSNGFWTVTEYLLQSLSTNGFSNAEAIKRKNINQLKLMLTPSNTATGRARHSS